MTEHRLEQSNSIAREETTRVRESLSLEAQAYMKDKSLSAGDKPAVTQNTLPPEFGNPEIVDNSKRKDERTRGVVEYQLDPSGSADGNNKPLKVLRSETAMFLEHSPKFMPVPVQLVRGPEGRIEEARHADGRKLRYDYDDTGALTGLQTGDVQWTRTATGWQCVDTKTLESNPFAATDVRLNKDGVLTVEKQECQLTFYPNGREIIRFHDGSKTDVYPNGLRIHSDDKGEVTETIFPGGCDRYTSYKTPEGTFVVHSVPQEPGSAGYVMGDKQRGRLSADGSVLIDDSHGKRKLLPDGTEKVMILRDPELPTTTAFYENGIRIDMVGREVLNLYRPGLNPGTVVSATDVRQIKVDRDLTVHYTDSSGAHRVKPAYR